MLQRDYRVRDVAERDGRTLELACVPFDAPAWVDDGDGPYREVFRRGAFSHITRAANRVELRYAHRQDGAPYGFGMELREDADYLRGVFRVAPSEDGDRLLGLVRDDQLQGVSVGYLPGVDRDGGDADGPLVERVRVKRLAEVSLTPSPAYEDARVLALREAAEDARRTAVAVEAARLRLLALRLGQ